MYFRNIYFSLRSNPITLEIFEPIAFFFFVNVRYQQFKLLSNIKPKKLNSFTCSMTIPLILNDS